jgi:hypothetical protein
MTLEVSDIRGDRFYVWHKKERFVSTTTAIGALPKKKLQDWKDRKLIEDYRLHEEHVRKMKPADVISYLKTQDMSTFASTGTDVHRYVEDIAKGRPLADADGTTAPFYSQVHNFLDDYRPNLIHSELTVLNRDWMYGGRIDLVVEIGGRRYVLDVKTGKAVYGEVGLQLASYANAGFVANMDGTESEMPDVRKDVGLVLHVRPDKYELRMVDIGTRVYQNFLSCLDVFNWSRSESDDIIGGILPIK